MTGRAQKEPRVAASGTTSTPPASPIIPVVLGSQTRVRFDCHKGVSCYNACCRQADIALTPYDVLCLKERLGMRSGEFLQKHTVPYEMDGDGLPGVKLRTHDDAPVCLFMNDDGCSVYGSRPSACRYYPVGLLAKHVAGSGSDEMTYHLVKEDHCKGHLEDRVRTLAEYRADQGVEEYDAMNREWYRIILKKKSAGPTVGKPPEMTFQLFFMASYDLDRFRRFVDSPGFRGAYVFDDDLWAELMGDDRALLKFGYRLMRQVFFDEHSIPMVEGAVEKRVRERAEVIRHRRALELALWREKQEREKRAVTERDGS